MGEKQIGIALLRILATFSVIVIHVSAPVVGEYNRISLFNWNVGNFFDSISRFSVPMFFMISGALLLNKDYLLRVFLKKRFLKILPPFIFWSLVYSVFKRFILGNESFNLFVSLDKITRDLFYGSEYHLWFVYVLLGIYLFTPIITKWVKNSTLNEILYFLTIWVFTIVYGIKELSIYFPKIELTYFSGYLGYFVLGYYLLNLKKANKLLSFLLLVFGILITIIGTYYFTLKNNEFYNYFYGYLTLNTLMVSTGLFLLLKNLSIKSGRLKSVLLKLNDYCFGIYLVHVLILRLFDLIGFNWQIFNPIVSVPVVSLSCSICSLIIICSIKKFNYGEYIAG